MCEVEMYILKLVKSPFQWSHVALNHCSLILKSKMMIFNFPFSKDN